MVRVVASDRRTCPYVCRRDALRLSQLGDGRPQDVWPRRTEPRAGAKLAGGSLSLSIIDRLKAAGLALR